MSGKGQIKDALKKLVKPNGDAYSVVCEVDSIDLSAMTCYCVTKNGTGDIQNVRLQAKTMDGFLIVPVVGSDVVVSFLSDSSAYVSMFSEIDKIEINVNDTVEMISIGQTTIKASVLNLNGSNYLGLVKITELKTALNLLQTDINTLKTAVTALMAGYAPIDGGIALAAYNAIVLGQINLTTLENTTVKHGNG